MMRLSATSLCAVATLAAADTDTAFDFTAIAETWGGDTSVLCQGYPDTLELVGASLTCGTGYVPVGKIAIADLCNRAPDANAGNVFDMRLTNTSFWQDFGQAARLASELGLQQDRLLAMTDEALPAPVPTDLSDLLTGQGFAPAPSAIARLTTLTPGGQMTVQAFQPYIRGDFAVAPPTTVSLGLADGFLSPVIDDTKNVLPTDRPRLPLCGDDDLDHNGEIRPANYATPILDSSLTAAVRIFDQREAIGSGVLISDRVVLTAAHVANLVTKEPLRFVQPGRIARPGNGTKIEKIVSLAPGQTTIINGLDLAVMLLNEPVSPVIASPTPILHSASAENISDAEAMTAGYGDRDNLQDGLTFDLAEHLGEPVPSDEGSILRGNRILRTRACAADGTIPECKSWERVYQYEPLMQDGATMPFTACENDSGSAAFVQTEGVNGRLVVSAIFAVASDKGSNGGCAKQMLFTDITAADTQDKLRAAIAALDPTIDVDSVFVMGELRRFGRIASANGG